MTRIKLWTVAATFVLVAADFTENYIESLPYPVTRVTPHIHHIQTSPPFTTCGPGIENAMLESSLETLGILPQTPFGQSPATFREVRAELRRYEKAIREEIRGVKGRSSSGIISGMESIAVLAKGFIELTTNHKVHYNHEYEQNHPGEAHPRISLNNIKGRADDESQLSDSLDNPTITVLDSHAISNLLHGLFTESNGQLVHHSKMISLGTALCTAAGSGTIFDFAGDVTVCEMTTLLANAMGCNQMKPDRTCTEAEYTATWPDLVNDCDRMYGPEGRGFNPDDPFPLPNFRPMSEAFFEGKLTEDAFNEEGPAYFALYQALLKGGMWADHYSVCAMPFEHEKFFKEYLPNWPTIGEVWLEQEGSKLPAKSQITSVPVTTVAKKGKISADGSCEFALFTRGTSTDVEWFINFQYAQEMMPDFGDPEMLAHRGYNTWNNYLVPAVLDFIEPYFENGECARASTRIIVAGHSLGGGISAIMSLRLWKAWEARGGPSDITMISFGSSRGLGKKAMELHKTVINSRTVLFDQDMIFDIPCANEPGMRRCNPMKYSGAWGSGVDKPFGEHSGIVWIPSWEMKDLIKDVTYGFFDNKFLRLALIGDESDGETDADVPYPKKYVNIPTALQIGAHHLCSYSCWFSAQFCTSDKTRTHWCAPDIGGQNPATCSTLGRTPTDDLGYTEPLASLTCAGSNFQEYEWRCDLIGGMNLG